MASVSARLSVFGENGYGEPDQDANSALMELDKGLRSGKTGEQCEAIVRFPRLFEKYPFPILINSALLKLADVFRLGNNFLKLCVLKVTQQSEKHLDKILNVDEFVRPIFSVIHSNDPVARALTLRTLGSIACIIPDRKNVHHSIRISFDSHDAVEMEAAIYAAGRFAACSKTLAANICSKLGDMIEGLSTPVEMKLKLVPIFQHMHHDAETAATVRKLCTNMLQNYPAQEFVMVTLNTLTQLAAASQIDIPAQVSLLMGYLKNDPRNAVKVVALQNLKALSIKGAHLWTEQDVQAVSLFAAETPYKQLKKLSLSLLTSLAKSVAVTKMDISSGSVTLKVCLESCYHSDPSVSAQAVQLLMYIAKHTFQEDFIEDGIDLFEEAVMAIESLLLVVTMPSNNNQTHIKALKICLLCAVTLCEVNTNVTNQFVDSLGTLIMRSTGAPAALLCEALAAIAGRKASVLNPLVPELMQCLQKVAVDFHQESSCGRLLVMLYVLLFQASHACQEGREKLSDALDALESVDLWICYRVARQAARYGCHAVASKLFSDLAVQVSSEHLYFWLASLWEICAGESCLSANGEPHIAKITDAITHYTKGISALKAATTPSHLLLFQSEYTRLRSEMLQAHAQLIRACTSYKTAPPPAIAAAVAVITRDELNRCGRIVTQLRKCVKEFRSLGDQFTKLYQSTFDADPLSLSNLQALQQGCFLMAYAIENIALKTHGIGFVNAEEEARFDATLGLSRHTSHCTIEVQGVINASFNASVIILQMAHQTDLKPVSYQHIDALLDVSRKLTEVPLCLPRYFFQPLQSTTIKLAISPQPRAPGEPINIQNSSHLALKVEGVIQHGIRPGMFRQVKKVVLSVSSQLQVRQHVPTHDGKVALENINSMTQTVEPRNDYFNAHFLLSFPSPGLHIITVEASVLDENEDLWKTGPKSILTAKSHDDASQKLGTSSHSSYSSRY